MRQIAFYAILLAFPAILLSSCVGRTSASRAEHYVRTTFRDVDRVLSVSVDTVTWADNLDYRIGQARQYARTAAIMYESFGGDSPREELDRETAWAAALDSLKDALAGLLDEPTAYNCVVTYNNWSNRVWVQLDTEGHLLNITKDPSQVLLNPGEDVPGYFEVWEKYHDIQQILSK